MFPFDLSLQQWSEIGSVITGLGVLFVMAQVWLMRRNGRVELITGMTTLIVEIDRLFIEYPTMKRYFAEGVPSPAKATDDWERANAIAMALANTLDHVVEHLSIMKPQTANSWRRYIDEVYERSGVFRELLDEHETWWPGLQLQLGRSQACIPHGRMPFGHVTSKTAAARLGGASP